MLKKSMVYLFMLFFFASFAKEKDYVSRLEEFANQFPNTQTELDELVVKYETPKLLETIEVNSSLIPNAPYGSKLYKYYFDNVGTFNYYYNGESKKTFLFFYELETPFVEKIRIPKDKDKIIEFFGDANINSENRLTYWGYPAIIFDFENNKLIRLHFSFWD